MRNEKRVTEKWLHSKHKKPKSFRVSIIAFKVIFMPIRICFIKISQIALKQGN